MTISCNLCGKDDYKILQLAGKHKVIKCKNCGLIFVNLPTENDRYISHYNQEYYALWLKEQFAAREKMWKRRLKKIQTFKRTGKLLDVGCGCGNFLKEAKYNGFQVYGTEVSEYAVNYVKNTFGREIFKGELKDANFQDNFFDVITLWHVLEHTTEPLDNLIEARRILKPDGILVVAVPNVKNYIYKIAYMLIKLKRPTLFSLSDREIHLYHFSENTLKKMLGKAGFKSIKFDIDKERILFRERITDNFAWAIRIILRVNFGMALEAWAQKY